MKAGRRPTAKTVKDYFASGSGRKLWKEGQAEKDNVGQGFGEFDDGQYRVKLVKAYTAMSNTTGRPQNVLGFKFMEGEYKGKIVSQYQGLDQKVGIAIAIQTLKILGQEIEQPEDIDAADKALAKEQPELKIRLRTKGEYQNVFVTELLGDGDGEEEDEDVDVEEDEDDEDEQPSKSSKSKKSDDDEDEESDDDSDSDSEDEDESDESDDEDSEDDEDDSDDESEDDDEEDEESEESDDEDEKKPSSKKSDKKTSKKKSKSTDDEEEEADEESEDQDEDSDEDEETEEEIALEPGMKLKVTYGGESVKAKIVKVDEKNEQVKVKLADGSKVTISVKDIEDVL